MVYEPREDSYFLLDYIKKRNFKGKIAVDMGCGSGILTKELAKRFDIVYAVDIDKRAVEICKNIAANVKTIRSDLFSDFPEELKGKIDLIVFNAPYLPCNYEEDKELCCSDGEIILRFLEEAIKFINENGKIVLLISDLTPVNLNIEPKETKKLAFETLKIYEI